MGVDLLLMYEVRWLHGVGTEGSSVGEVSMGRRVLIGERVR